MLDSFFSGAIVLGASLIAFFFHRFQRATGDRLFGFFAAAFFLFALERVGTEFISSQPQSYVYIIRLCAFLLLAVGILDKNRKEGR